jgi:hypothetical protein
VVAPAEQRLGPFVERAGLEAGIKHRAHGRVGGKEPRELQGVVAVAVEPQLEGVDPGGMDPGGMR